MFRRSFLLGMAGAAACRRTRSVPPSADHQLLGRALPLVERRTVDGSRVNTGQAAGRVIVVKFFAEYCKPCVKTLPVAQDVHRRHDQVFLVGVAEDEYRSSVARMIETHGLTFPVVHDAAHSLAGRFRVTEMPITFVTDRSGVIRWIGGPDQPHDALDAVVRQMATN